ncbi:MAG TPA: transglycosylase SLT domain-containing protein [Fibrobacteria bacterium]|nr:transglycosylase SLT domain-containing protein [Fibrobacteria bacterium]
MPDKESGNGRSWTLAMRPTVFGICLLAAAFLAETAMVVVLGERNSRSRLEQARIRVRLDSLETARGTLARTCQVRDLLVDVSHGGISGREAAYLAREIDRNARFYDFDPLLILAVVMTESGADFEAVGHGAGGAPSGALGVMQVRPATARAMAVALGKPVPSETDLMDAGYNLSVGVAFLLQMIHRYGDLRLGIMAYNVGPSGLESGLRGESALPEGYFRKVLRMYGELRRESSRTAG